jgi:hypothetical protein
MPHEAKCIGVPPNRTPLDVDRSAAPDREHRQLPVGVVELAVEKGDDRLRRRRRIGANDRGHRE